MSQPLQFGLDRLGMSRPGLRVPHCPMSPSSATSSRRRFSPTRQAADGPGGVRSAIPPRSLHVGAPETAARKIAKTVAALGISHFHLKYSAGDLSHDRLMRSIDVYGRKAIPLVRDMLT